MSDQCLDTDGHDTVEGGVSLPAVGGVGRPTDDRMSTGLGRGGRVVEPVSQRLSDRWRWVPDVGRRRRRFIG